MNRVVAILSCVAAAAALAGAGAPSSEAGAAPTISSLSATAVPRSGRVLINGSGFGAARGASTVTIGGVDAPVVRWSDTLIKAYAPEGAPLGVDDVRVTVDGASSAPVPLTVEARQPAGRVRWRFQVEGQYVLQRPAVGPDGGVVVVSSSGDVYSLSADGGLRWVVPFGGGDGVASIGPDGTVYVASMNTVKAIAPSGSIKWTFTEPSSGQGVMAGPTVGPDGNVYVISDYGGLGAFALSPTGKLLWSNVGKPAFLEVGQTGVEVVFGSGQLYAGFDEQGVALSMMYGLSLGGSQRWARELGGSDDIFMQRQRQPATGADGSLYLTAMGGANGWSLYRIDPASGAVKWGYSPYPANGMSPPDVGPDGSVYFSRSLGYLESVTPTGQSRWTFSDGSIIDYPVVSPDGATVVAGDRPNFGEPGSVRGWNAATGTLAWQADLASENGGYQIVYSRPRFSKDSGTVYVGTAILGSNNPDQYSYLYAVDATATGAQPPPPPPPSASPTISSLTPDSGRTGSTVTIDGTNFSGATSVKLAGKKARFKLLSATRITATVPNGAVTGKVTVVTPNGTATSAGAFTVTLSITGLTPTSGPLGTVVTVSGVGFAGATAVKFAGKAASFTVVSGTSIRATVPAGATSGPVTVTAGAGTVRSARSFSVTA